MRPISASRAAALALPLLLAAAPACAQAPSAANVVAFVDVNVLPMDTSRVLAGQTVLVRGDRIERVGPAASVAVPAGATVVDGRGKWLMPGLAEMHGHVPPPTAQAQYTEDVLFLYVAAGVTTVRGMLGAPNQLELRRRAAAGEVVAPTLYLAGPSFNGNSVSSPAQAEAMVRAQKAEGWDLLKVHPGLTRDEYDAMARTAREVGIRFGGHVPAEVGLQHALEMGQETFDHLDGYVEHLRGGDGPVRADSLDAIVARTKAAGAWAVPTMALWEVILNTARLEDLLAYEELRYVSPQQVEQWTNAYRTRAASPQYDAAEARRVVDARMRVLGAMNRAGARILMGTDAPQQFSVPGFSLHRELARMRDAGMSPWEVLRSGTRVVGEYFAASDRFGTVAPGMRADLVLLEANPLDDLAHLQRRGGVMVRGRWIPEAEIRARLDAIAARLRP